ncbi:MAG TPA: DUF2000 domain-containing protein [Archangium sp.]|jgi:hypothetical protein|uniref:DUF2000 domain-containing protein n=1 Tax=Archangium sp. TaxID=1872627 RepID=UPI002ED9866F
MNKCVFVIDAELPLGLIANTAAVLALSLGQRHPELVGADLPDGGGDLHAGLTTLVMPVLKGSAGTLGGIRRKVQAMPGAGLLLIDVTDAAQQTKTYDDYAQRLGETGSGDLRYLGLCIYGPADTVKSVTGNLPLLR